MNTVVPVTFSLPIFVHKRLLKHVPPRKRSQYASEAISSRLVSDIIDKKAKDPWKEFFALGKKLNLSVTTEQIIQAKNFGRD